MKVISLKSFAKSGSFGNIKMGTLKKDVISILGDDYDYADLNQTQILKYGWYEFFFRKEDEKLFGFQNDHLQADCSNHDEMILFENKNFKIDTWFLKVGLNIDYNELKRILSKERIKFKEKILFKNEPILQLHNGIYFDFNEYPTESQEDSTIEIKKREYLLNGIRLFNDV